MQPLLLTCFACPNGLLLSLVLFAVVTRFWSLMSMLFLSYLGPFHHHIHNSFNSRHLQTRVSFNYNIHKS
ncbi:hypothetical protein Hanom_Chr13g01240941 [Helianthus anomalus]